MLQKNRCQPIKENILSLVCRNQEVGWNKTHWKNLAICMDNPWFCSVQFLSFDAQQLCWPFKTLFLHSRILEKWSLKALAWKLLNQLLVVHFFLQLRSGLHFAFGFHLCLLKWYLFQWVPYDTSQRGNLLALLGG